MHENVTHDTVSPEIFNISIMEFADVHPSNCFYAHFFIYPWVNLITLSALSACQDGAEILSWDEQIACNFPTFYLCVWMSACIFADSSVSPFLLLLAALLWPCLPARCSTWGLWALRGDSWHGSEYMCFWNDKLSNVSNVSAPVRLQSSPHI